jgi:imidazolonepropionase-like amidohydrolase
MRAVLLSLLLIAFAGCAARGGARAGSRDAADSSDAPENPFPSTYRPFPSGVTLIRGATVMTAAGQVFPGGAVLLRDGEIAAVGPSIEVPPGATVIDASGRFVTPGIIDTHSHLGAYPSPAVSAHSDGNEITDPNTAEVWVEHSVWPQDPGFVRALEGGITTLQILPGSANLFGGRGVTLRNIPARSVQQMKFPGAPHGLKMACGENPKRVYGERGRAPSTRMGNVAGYRAAWIRAEEYRRRWDAWREGAQAPASMPTRDLELETLAGVLNGDILVHNHCYRADEMAQMVDIAEEFGYEIRSFHHGVEAYKIRDLLAEKGIAGSLWADWWGFKMEAMDFTKANVALVHEAGARAIVHSDDPVGIQRLNQEAAKALRAGRDAGLEISEDDALRWITANAAWALGVEDEVGTLEEGKRADVVIWSHNPFSVYARADQVFIDGALVLDRSDPARRPSTDFEVGIGARGANE